MNIEEIGLEILEHHGIKGMKWGVRREQMRISSATRRGEKEVRRQTSRPPSPIRVTPTIGRSSFTKSKVKTVGGEDHPPHEDAIKVAVSRQKMKKSGTDALSNAELQEMAQRMNLEQQVHSLNIKRPKSVGRGFVDSALGRAQKDPIKALEKTNEFVKTAERARKALKVAAVAAA